MCDIFDDIDMNDIKSALENNGVTVNKTESSAISNNLFIQKVIQDIKQLTNSVGGVGYEYS